MKRVSWLKICWLRSMRTTSYDVRALFLRFKHTYLEVGGIGLTRIDLGLDLHPWIYALWAERIFLVGF